MVLIFIEKLMMIITHSRKLFCRNDEVNMTDGGVTIVKVKGNRNDVPNSNNRADLVPTARDLAIFQSHVAAASKINHKYQKHCDTSRSTGRLITTTNRSMPKLNACKLIT